MILWKRALLLGCLSWQIPFVLSFILFPLKKSNAPLFGTLMDLVILLTAAALLNAIFETGLYRSTKPCWLELAFGAARLAQP